MNKGIVSKVAERPLVSVIVASYNHDQYLGRCIRSLLGQTFLRPDYEIIVVDDGSTDRTQHELEQFSNEIRVSKNEDNIGLPASLNKAIAVASARYVVRVDSDDYVNKNFLSFLTEYLRMNPDTDAVACDYLVVDNDENVIRRENCEIEPIACGILFKREQLIELGLYDEDFRLHEERDLRIRFEAKYKIDRLGMPLYRYRRHESNITNHDSNVAHYLRKLEKKHNKAQVMQVKKKAEQ